MLYYESDAGVTELIPFGGINADEILLCIDSVGSVWGVVDLSSWAPRQTYYHFYGGDLCTALEKIPMSKEYQEKHIQDQIDEIINYVEEYKHDRNQNFTVKQLEKTKKKLEARLEKLNDDFKKDDVITFEELGVDKLFVDEAHNYKNLYLYTKMRNVAGIGQSEAFKSSDMFMKCRYMDEMTGGKGIVFATGTPVSNSMTELYTYTYTS